jgi:tetratricopeptide (TPR) repeat protein
MIPMLGPKAIKRLLGVCLAVSGLAHAAVKPAPVVPDPLKIDQSVQALKEEALSLSRELLSLDETLLYPDVSRVAIYVSVKVGGFLLEEMAITLDNGQEIRYHYSESESKSLLKQGVHRFLRTNLTPGAHRLQAQFVGRFVDADPKDKPIRGALETVFQKDLDPMELVLPVGRSSRLNRPGLPEVTRMESTQLRGPRRAIALDAKPVAAPKSYAAGSSDDPKLGMAIFLKNDKRFFSALSELLRIAAAAPDPEQLSAAYYEQLAECYLNFGLPDRAGAIYQRLAVETKRGPAAQARSKIRLAEFLLQRGYIPEATQLLQELSETIPEEVLLEWQELLSRTLMIQGHYADAIEVITEHKNAEKLSAFARYNLGIALINDGKLEPGRSLLDHIGTMKVPDQESLVLRDKANLMLGYHFLRSQQGGTAKPIFGRVRTEGPYSNRALLGLGWSELAPRGDRQQRVATPADPQDQSPFSTFSSLGVLIRLGYYDNDPFKRLGVRPFKMNKLSQDEGDALKRALVPWTELSTRDTMDPAVQEGLLAIPFALDRLKAHEQALQLYQRAIDTLEEARKRMDKAATSIKEGRMVETIVRRDLDAESGWLWRLRDLPDAPETYFLQTLLAEDRFQESLKNYRDVRLLGRSLDVWKSRLDGFEQGVPEQKQPDLPPELFVARARQGWTPPYVILSIPLASEAIMSMPGKFDAPLPPETQPPLKLIPVWGPQEADGAFERMKALRGRMDMLRPKLTAAGADSSRLLQAVAVAELAGQKRQIEKYLVEARLAVARLYDRESKDSAISAEPGETSKGEKP